MSQFGSFARLSIPGGNAAGTFAGFLAGGVSTAFGCALSTSPLGVIVAAVQTSIDIASALIDCFPPSGAGRLRGRTVASHDPNDKGGPAGAGAARFFDGQSPLSYVIRFENISTATAPAQEVLITDQLDVGKFDLTTFSFGDMTIGSERISPLPNRTVFNADFDLRPANSIIARISARLDVPTGVITWRFRSIDPATSLPTDDPLAGILPPNTAPPRGEGSVMFTVAARSTLLTGDEIRNRARIVFDTNTPIDTNQWLNTIDKAKPVSSVQALPQVSPSTFSVNWSGTDAGAGISTYTIYVSDDGAPFAPFLTNTASLSTVFSGQIRHTYRFYSIARDAVGNEEGAKTTAEATTTTTGTPTPTPTPTPGGTGLEADLSPRPMGGGSLTAADSAQFKRFIAGLDTFSTTENEFQRTDVAPEDTFGDGRLDAADQQQINNYVAVLDPPRIGGGPTGPVQEPFTYKSQDNPAEGKGRSYRIVSTAGAHRSEIIVTIELDAKGNETGMSFTLGFDPSRLSFSGVSGTNNNPDVTDASGSPTGMNRTLNATQSHHGRLGLLLDAASPFEAGTRQIVSLRFRVLADAAIGLTSLTFGDDSITRSTTNAEAQSLDAIYQDGEITINSRFGAKTFPGCRQPFPFGRRIR